MTNEAKLIKVQVNINDEYIKVAEAMAELQHVAHVAGVGLDEIYGVEEGKKQLENGKAVPYTMCVRMTDKPLSVIEREIADSISMNEALGYGFDEKFYLTNKWVEEVNLFV